MTVLQSTLRLSLLDMVTGKAAGISRALTSLNNAAARNSAAMDRMRGRMAESLGAGYALAQALSAPIKAAVDFESTMADIKKVVDFPTPVAFAEMGKAIRDMSLRIPMAADGIGQIVAAAGQSDIARGDLLTFTEMAAKVAVAWDVTAGVAGTALAQMKTATGRSVANTGKLADAINHLGNNSAAGAADILTVVSSVASSAKQFGMSAEQVAALGAAMTGAGFESNVAATSILNVGRALTKGGSASGRQVAAYKKLGLTSKGVAKSMQKDAMGTLQDVLARIGKVPDHLRASIISDLFGDEARALGPLISNSKLLAETLGLVADETQYAGSAQKEFDARSDTTANAMQLFRNRVSDLAISVGDTLIPALNHLMDSFTPMITSVRDLVDRYPKLTAGIIGTTAAVIGLRVAMTGLSWAGLYMTGGLLRTALAGTKGVGVLSKALGISGVSSRRSAKAAVENAKALVLQTRESYQSAKATLELAKSGQVAGVTVKQATANLSAAGKAATSAQAGLKAANASLMTTGLRGMLVALPGVSAISGVLAGIGAGLATISAPVWLGIGAAVAVVAGAGVMLYRYWDRVKAVVSGVASALGERLGPVINRVTPYLNKLAPAFNAVGKAVDWVKEKFSAAMDFISGLFDREILGEEQSAAMSANAKDITNRIIDGLLSGIGKLYEVGSQMVQNLWDGMTAKFDEFLAYVKDIPSRIVAAIGKVDLSNVFKIPAASWGGGGGGNTAFGPGTPPAPTANAPGVVAVDGARADGGPVRSGKTYLVGERGPELFSPRQSGVIASNKILQQANALNKPPAIRANHTVMVPPTEVYQQARAASSASTSTPATRPPVVIYLNNTFNVTGIFDPRKAADEAVNKLSEAVRNAVESSFGASFDG